MAIKRVWLPSPCYSSRSSAVRLVVVHNTEGIRDIYSLGNFFGNSTNKVSSHAGADNINANLLGEYVKRGNSAWTQGDANGYCVALEQCAPNGASANWSRDYWINSQNTLLRNSAAWIAEECKHYGIPIVALTSSQAQSGARGVCQHVNLGAAGGGHYDCGPGYPLDYVLKLATGSMPTLEDDDMTPGVCSWYNPATDKSDWYQTCVGKDDKRVYYLGPDTNGKWVMVDPGSKAIGGATIAAAKNGALRIVYTATSNKVVCYTRNSGGGGWGWTDLGGNAAA